MTFGDGIVLFLLAAAIGGAILGMRNRHRHSCGGCTGDCSGCVHRKNVLKK